MSQVTVILNSMEFSYEDVDRWTLPRQDQTHYEPNFFLIGAIAKARVIAEGLGATDIEVMLSPDDFRQIAEIGERAVRQKKIVKAFEQFKDE